MRKLKLKFNYRLPALQWTFLLSLMTVIRRGRSRFQVKCSFSAHYS